MKKNFILITTIFLSVVSMSAAQTTTASVISQINEDGKAAISTVYTDGKAAVTTLYSDGKDASGVTIENCSTTVALWSLLLTFGNYPSDEIHKLGGVVI